MANPEDGIYPSEGRVEFLDFDNYPDLIEDESYGKGTVDSSVTAFLDKNALPAALIAIAGAAEPNQE